MRISDWSTDVCSSDLCATADQGTGFVHIAPGHGADDFQLGQKHGLEIPQTVADDGSFYDHVPLFAGMNVIDDNMKVAAIIRDHGGRVARGKIGRASGRERGCPYV